MVELLLLTMMNDGRLLLLCEVVLQMAGNGVGNIVQCIITLYFNYKCGDN